MSTVLEPRRTGRGTMGSFDDSDNGTCPLVLDAKGRARLPAFVRSHFGAEVVVACNLNQSINVWRTEIWDAVARELADSPEFFRRCVSTAKLQPVDATTDRFFLDITHRQHLGVKPGDEVVAVGVSSGLALVRSDNLLSYLRHRAPLSLIAPIPVRRRAVLRATGTYHMSVCRKGRCSIPVRLRRYFGETAMVTLLPEGALLLHSFKAWRQLGRRCDSVLLTELAEDTSERIFQESLADRLSTGKLQLNPVERRHAQALPPASIVLVGLGSCVLLVQEELWCNEQFSKTLVGRLHRDLRLDLIF